MRTGLKIFVLCLAAAYAAPPRDVSAQTMRGGMQQSPADGPRLAGWVFTPSLATGGSWDDNLLLVDPNDVALRDYAMPLSPALSLDYRGRRVELSTSYDSSFLMYRELSQLNSSQQSVNTSLEYRLNSRVAVSTQGTYSVSPTTDSLVLGGGVPFYRIGTRTASGGAGVDAMIARRTLLAATYTRSAVSFEEDDRLETPLEGGYTHEGRLAATRAFTSRLNLGLQYDIRRAVLSGGDDRFNIQSASLTFDRRITPSMSASGFLGVAVLGAGLRHDAHVGPTVGVALMRRARLAMMTAAYQRTFIPSWGFGGTSQNEEWMLGVRVPMARNRAYVDGRATWMDADSIEVDQPSIQSLWLGLTLGYRATRWLNVETYYNGSGQNTNEAGGDRRRNIVGFRLVAIKPMKLG